VQYAGLRAGSERVVRRGDPSGRKWALAWLTGDRLDAVLTGDRPRGLVQARRVIAAGTPVAPGALADPHVPVRQAVRGWRRPRGRYGCAGGLTVPEEW